MGLRKWQRNEIFEAVRDAGLSPDEFDWEPDSGVDESLLRHRRSGAYFVCGGVAGNYVSHYLAGDGPIEERSGLGPYRLMEQVKNWLSAVKNDVETPDLWARLANEAVLLGAVSGDEIENTPLTTAEQEAIAGQLMELRDHISRAYSLSASETQQLEARLDYLAAAANRVGRKDWLLMAAGLIVSYVLGVALPPEAASHILGTLLANIRHVLWYGPLELPGG